MKSRVDILEYEIGKQYSKYPLDYSFPIFYDLDQVVETIKKIDKEYSCLSSAEQLYLSSKGIKYNFVKVLDG